MNGELPLIAVGGSGAALLAGIHMYERRNAEKMRRSRKGWRLRFPDGLEPLRALAAVDALCGLPPTVELVGETVATDGRIEHCLWVPEAVRASVIATLTGVLGSLGVTEAQEPSTGLATLSLKIFVPTPFLASSDHVAEASRGLLSGLAGLRRDEQVSIKWALVAGTGRRWQPPADADASEKEIERAWRRKLSGGVFAASGLVLVKAGSAARARELARHVESAMRSRQGVAGRLRITIGRGNRRMNALPQVGLSSGTLSGAELLGAFLAWPLGSDPIQGVEVGTSRTLAVPRAVPRKGIRLFVGEDAYGEREVAHSPISATHHTILAGASGTGKSTLLANAALSCIEGGHGGILVDPKSDLVGAILARVRPQDAGRVVVLDPGDRTRPIPGISVMTAGDPDLRADVLTNAIRSAFPADAWGVRTSHYLRTAIRTLAETGGTLLDVGRLFFDERYLRAAITRLRDPYLTASWQAYLGLSPGARAEHVQAPMNRIMALLARPQIRAVIAATEPKLDIGRLLRERSLLLVNLAPGLLGESGSAVLGSIVMYAAWSAIEARVSLPSEQRHPVFVFVDELATLAHGTPFGFELLAERARGLGAGLFVSLQTLGRIPEPMRGAILGNAASLIVFRSQEAAVIARHLPGLSEADIMGLPRFGVAARLGTGIGSSVAVVTGHTMPLPPETGMAEAIRDASAGRYGSQSKPENEPADPADDGGRTEPSLGRGRREH